MGRKILIVDDSEINRQMLIQSLSDEYDIIEASDGKEALSLMHRNYKMLSAVLLDIVMPEMDGYEVLRNIRDNILLAQVPVIVVTGSEDEDARLKALSYGANDFILKPFNPEIVRHCLKNNIALRETASILNAIQKDKLTGLYNRESFFERVNSMVSDHEPGYYILSCFDIDNFKLINDQYGASEGDRILKEIGIAVRTNAREIGGIGGRISADNFAALFPAHEEVTVVLQRILDKNLISAEQQYISFSIGRYVVSDVTLPASSIYDRAFIAKQSVKGRYDKHLAYFDDTMLETLIREQEITGEMENALNTNQFEAWFQPQYNHATGELMGAEALARWRHPVKGIIPPADFIPLFESNGFVYELDKYIWRDVCSHMKQWINEGCTVLPVSVNISRYDIFRTDLIDVLMGLVEEFNIPVDMFRLEITESAFTLNSERIVEIVKKLIALGFTVEIDDFGSGYSSLNTLKNVPAQIVKLDMAFLGGDEDSKRGGNILESIVRMTKWLGMTVVAEGVEEQNQADFLKSIGCSYVQGYLYAKPMTAAEYRKLLDGVTIEQHPFLSKSDEILANDAFWDPKSIDSMIFNRYAGGACVYEFYNDKIEMVRVTDKYIRSVFGDEMTAEDAMKIDWTSHINADTGKQIRDDMLKSIEIGEEVSGEYCFIDLPGCPRETYLYSSLRVIASTEGRYLVYCTSVNTTPQREAELQNAAMTDQLQAVMDNVGCGITAITYNDVDVEYLMINKRYYDILGYTEEEYQNIETFSPIYNQDRDWVSETARKAYEENQPVYIEYRVVKSNGSIIWVSDFMTITRIAGIDKPVQLSIFNDITERKDAEEKLRVSEEINRIAIEQSNNVVCRYDIGKKRLYIPPVSNPIFVVDAVEENIPYKKRNSGDISEETIDSYMDFYERIIRGEKEGKAVFQKKSVIGWRWLETKFTTIFSSSGEPNSAVITYADITENTKKDAVYRKYRQSFHERDSLSYSLYHCNINNNTLLNCEGELIKSDLEQIKSSGFEKFIISYVNNNVIEADIQAMLTVLNRNIQSARFAQNNKNDSIEYREALPDDATRWIRLTIDLLEASHSGDIEAYLLFENIDDSKRAELDIKERAETDPLTGVLNRTTFTQMVDSLISNSERDARHALLMVDLDSFKMVNDAFGHSAGDQVLIDVSKILSRGARQKDLVGRIGGDEFVIFLSYIPDKESVAAKAESICNNVKKSLREDIMLSASVGIARYPMDGNCFEELYKNADKTLYDIKGSGKDSFAFYHDEISVDKETSHEIQPKKAAVKPSEKKYRMLIVDDNQLDCAMLAKMFDSEFRTDIVGDGAAALERLQHYGSAMSIVLLDLMMPGIDGITVLERMQKDINTRPIPVIVVSGASDQEIAMKAIRAGAADFITKPVNPDVLKIRVQSAISKAENQRLRIMNSFLELQSNEMLSYRKALMQTGTFVIVHDWAKSTFIYSPDVSNHLAGNYDGRTLWRILLSDLVADSQTVKNMQHLIHDVANNRNRTDGSMTVLLKSVSGKKELYEMNVYKETDIYGLADKLTLTFKEKGSK